MRFYKTMRCGAAILLILTVNSVYTKSLDQSHDNSLDNLDQGSRIELKNMDQDLSSTLTSQGTTTVKPGFLGWLLTPLAQSLQINPQALLQDRVTRLKETLNSFGSTNREGVKAKQLNNANNLLHVTGVNDPGFYTNRLEPAGFFGGNGWLANKGGILGGPGAILSTGSLLTDYPSAYKRK